MTREELREHYYINNGTNYTPEFNVVAKIDENGNKYYDYTITKTAESVYNEIMENKNKQQPSELEKIKGNIDYLAMKIGVDLDDGQKF